ncbi:MAG TPA: lyase family protein, partial [Candidatus Limnocylindrales bacterium]|nr:lyase family protein [Candidatus Limnocylindrales bacterium]
MWVRGGAAELASDEAWLRAMGEVESALAAASAVAGLIPESDAGRIESVLGELILDTAEIALEASATGTPVVPLVERIRAAVGPEAAGSVHRGATSQDILDSATMLVARRALAPILEDLAGASEAAAGLAAVHRTTPIAGRTLLQRAVPTTFGLKAANWMLGLDRAADRLQEIRRVGLAVQVGGVAGTRAGYGGHGQRIAEEMADRLGLSVPVAPWHTERTRIGDLASGLGVAAGAIAKAARDIVLLAQTEVAEVEEGVPGRGGSSALQDKHNPIAAISAVACAQRSFGLVATLFATMVQEHERGAGNWQAEWVPLRQLLITVDSAAAWLRDSLEHLIVRPDAMARNLGDEAPPDLGDA